MGDKAWGHVRKLVKEGYSFVSMCETHINQQQIGKWRRKARDDNLKLYANAARSKSKWTSSAGSGYANEGGEFSLVVRHKPACILDEARAVPGLRPERGSSFDGFVPVLLEQKRVFDCRHHLLRPLCHRYERSECSKILRARLSPSRPSASLD
eukprot:628580-Pyramimonas_sp.AAC.1